jgi:two-component system, NtrC family, sensor histidine kinase KinB
MAQGLLLKLHAANKRERFHMTLKQKILTGYGAIFLLMCMVVAWAVVNLISLREGTDAILRENYRRITTAGKILEALERQNSAILMIFLGDAETGVSKFQKNEAEILELFGVAKQNMYLPGEKEIDESMMAYYEDYRKQFSAITYMLDQGKPISATPLVFYEESVYPLFLRVRDRCLKLRDLNEDAMHNASVRAGYFAGRTISSTAIVAALGLFTVLILSLLLAERIVRPLKQFNVASRKIAEGDYSVQVRIDTKDELGSLAGEFNKMAQQLRQFSEMNIEKIIIEKNKNEGIISSIDDGIVVFDAELKVTGINPAARRILDLEFIEYTTLKCDDIIPVPHVCELIRKTIETGAKPKDVPDEQRIVMLQQDGKSYHYMISITVTKGSEGTLSGVVLLLRDVTRLKELENLKNDFVMAASHELRTPLTSMAMSIDLLLEHIAPKLNAKDKDLILTAHEEVQRMKALVNDLLDLSKMEAGKINLELDSIAVQNIFDQIKDLFRNQIDVKNVSLSSKLSENLPSVRADENKIMWVLTNLISNALRYVRTGGHIRLFADKVGAHVHLSVIDDGTGIPLEYQSKIFHKFVQVNGQEPGGTGLGLAICKEIVRAHRGTIWVESSPGHGSTFTFTLPIAE